VIVRPNGDEETIRIITARAATKREKRRYEPCRHHEAVLWLHRGGSTSALQLILGHDHLATTEIYLNLSPQEVLAEFQRRWK